MSHRAVRPLTGTLTRNPNRGTVRGNTSFSKPWELGNGTRFSESCWRLPPRYSRIPGSIKATGFAPKNLHWGAVQARPGLEPEPTGSTFHERL